MITALEYYDAGWYPIELNDDLTPRWKGTTGKTGTWCTRGQAARMRGQIGLRMPRFVIGVDIDSHKEGPLDEALVQACVDSKAPRSTSRIDHYSSGIYFFKCPWEWTTRVEPNHIEFIRWSFRYARVHPSTGKTGKTYHWVRTGSDSVVPLVATLPTIPSELLPYISIDYPRAALETRERY